MKFNFLKNAMIALMIVSLAGIMFSCKDDKEGDKADKTALTALITECEGLLNAATTVDWPQSAIDIFTTAINTAKVASEKKGITQQEVDNVVTNLEAAKKVFVESAYNAIPSAALLIGLSFDEGEGTQLTAEGKNLVAKLNAGPSEIFGANTAIPTFINGKKGKAMMFKDGAHLAIETFSAADFQGKKLSIAVWVKPENTRPGNYIISYNYWNSWKFQIQENNKPFFTVHTSIGADEGWTDADNEADFSAPNGEWTHLVTVLDLENETLDFYVNGELTKHWTSETKPGLKGTVFIYDKNLPILIGACTTYAEADGWPWDWNRTPEGWDWFFGAMDELKVYNIALTQGQVTKLFDSEK